MLTISISESLSTGAQAYSEWNSDADSSNAEHCYTPWGPQSLQRLNQLSSFDIWKSQPDEKLGKSMWPPAANEMPWQVPQKLAVEGGDSILPTSSWASPLRVPLPNPVEHRLLEEESLALPPGLSDKGFPPRPPGLTEELPPGISIFNVDVSGSVCARVDWCIEDLVGKLQASMGRPLVSPPFLARGLPNLRLMVFPDGRDTMKNARSSERKALYTAMIKKGPLNGALKLKADYLQSSTVMTVNLIVGKIRSGPLIFDFSEQAIHGLDDFGVDWLQQVDRASGSLIVGIEILNVRPKNQ